MKRVLSIITAVVMTVSLCVVPVYARTYEEAAAEAENAEINYNRSVPLEVKGNKIVKQGTDEMVVLRGVNVPSMDWGMAEHLYESMTMVYDCWGANLIRLPIHPKYWKDGSIWDGKNLTKEQYQKYVDDMVKAAQARGKYIILDCHRYVMPQQDDLDMLKELAVKYGNNSAVLFGLLNEPHDIKPTNIEKPTMADQWEVWYNGGQIIVGGEEVTAIGHQQLLNEIRALGANNICIAGGLNWAFDISGLADGYNGRENGYRLTDTAEGHGVMYDSHAYPVKGAKSAWDTTIGPVRRVAPILIGEWGWDSSDKNISGGDCTSDIWMNQIMNWMDDTDNQYDGIPVNWTAWNLHMSSSPRMLYSWDYKTTAYNGTYIKNRLQSYGNLPETQDGIYSTDFGSNNVFRGYTTPSGATSVSYSEDNENIVVSHKPADWYATLNFPFDWDLNGIQTITMDISADTAETLNIGLYGSDMEEWTTPVKVDNTVKNVTLSIDQLVRQGNQQTDGILNGAVSGIYIGSNATETANNTKVVTMADEDNTAEYKINNYENGKVSVRKRTDAEDSASTVIVAFYGNNSVLTGISTANIQADEKGDEIIKTVEEPASYSYAEVFMWDSLNGMVPRCNPMSNKVNITIDNIKIVKLAEPIYTATEYPHTDIGAESYIDVDNMDFASQSTTKGAASTSYFKCENAEVIGADGENTQAKYITYDRRDGLYGGTVQFNLETVPSKDTKYFTISLKGSGTAQTINVNLGSVVSYNIALAEGDTDWHQYIFDISYGAQYPEDIAFVRLASNTKIESYFYADNFGFSKTKPERVIPNPEKTFIYDFATYNRNTAKYEAVISTMQGSDRDEIKAAKVDGGLDFETQALEITYSRNGNIPSKAKVTYSPADFFKGNSNDDERTANRATLKADMEYMTDLVFYGKSTSDKNEKINVGVIDAANSMMTYTDTKEFTLTSEWQQFRVPFDEFKVLDGGSELDCSRVRGFVFSSAENSGEGSFIIDNITHTSVADIEWAEPTPTPPPTPKVVSTVEELTALTSSDNLIVLGDDIDLDTEGIQTKCAMRLDLNGHTLSSSANTAIDVLHNFTLVDTGETKGALKNTGTGYALKGSGKNITVSIDGAEVDSVGGQAIMSNTQDVTMNIIDAVINGNIDAINFANGTLNIENVVTNNSEDYKGYALAAANSKVTINGGTFNYYGTVSSITLSGASTVTINDGIFTNSVNKRGAINTLKGFSGTLTINGGIFENTNANGYSILDGDEATTEIAPTINITGGIFKSIMAKRDTSTTQMFITGGQFASDPTITYENCVDIEKYSITKVAEGKYVVTEKGAEPTPEPTPVEIVTTLDEFKTAIAKAGVITKLGADIDLGSTGIKTYYPIYLDLNGHTLTSSAGTALELTKDFTLADTGTTKGLFEITGSGIKCAAKELTVNIDGAEIDATAQAILLTGANSTINIKDAVINGGSYAINASNGILNIENTVINNKENYTGYALSASGGTVTIDNSTFDYNGTMNTAIVSGSSTVTINDGIFTNSNGNRGVINTAKGFSGVLTINGGTFENTASNGYSILDSDEGTTETAPTINITSGIFKSAIGKTKNTSTTQMFITGGQFASDPTEIYDGCVDTEEYSVTKVAAGKYIVTEKGAEPTPEPEPDPTPTPEEVVTTLDEFKTAIAKTDIIVKLGDNIDLGSTGIKTYYPIHLDLNGHTLTSSAGTALELTKDFTLVDTGTTKGLFEITGSGIKCAAKELTVNIDGAEIDATAQAILLTGANSTVNIKDAVINGGSYAINASNGTLNIENTVINNKENYTGYALSVSGGTATIENSTFNYNGTANTVSLSGTSIVTINGGTFINSAKNKGAIEVGKYFAGTLTISGGIFKNNNNGGYSILDSNEGYRVTDSETGEIIASPVINITGGTFKSEIGRIKPNNTITKIVVSGGTFSFNPEVYVNSETHSVTRISDNTYSVTLKGEEPSPAPTEEPTPTPTVDPTVTTSPTPTPTVDPDATTPPTDEPTPTADPDVTTPPTEEPTPTPIPVPTEMPEGEAIDISTPADLVAALTNGGTYKVADGVNELDCDSLTLSVRKSINIDFNGAKIINLVSNGFDIQGNLSVRFKNGTFVGTGTYAIKAMAKTTSLIILDNITTEGATNGIASGNSYCAIEINGGNLGGKTYGINCGMGNYIVKNAVTAGILIGNESTIEFNDTEITVTGTGITASGSASVMLDGCTVTGSNSGMSWKSSGTLDIKNSTVASSANGKATISIENTPAMINITNSQISNTNETANKAYIISTNATAADSKITIDGGTYTGVFSINSANPTALVIKSGTFSTDPTPYVDKSESTVKENSDNTYTVETML